MVYVFYILLLLRVQDNVNNLMDHHLISSKTLALEHAGQVIADRLHEQNCYSNTLLGYYSCMILPPKFGHLSINFTSLPLNIFYSYNTLLESAWEGDNDFVLVQSHYIICCVLVIDHSIAVLLLANFYTLAI